MFSENTLEKEKIIERHIVKLKWVLVARLSKVNRI